MDSESESYDDFVETVDVVEPTHEQTPETLEEKTVGSDGQFEPHEDFVEPKTATSNLDLTSPYPWIFHQNFFWEVEDDKNRP